MQLNVPMIKNKTDFLSITSNQNGEEILRLKFLHLKCKYPPFEPFVSFFGGFGQQG